MLNLTDGSWTAEWISIEDGRMLQRKTVVAKTGEACMPASGNWYDTEREISDASDAILAAVRGASPTNPVRGVPVGPGTNVALALSAIISKRLDLGWIKQVEHVTVAGPDQDYAWALSDDPSAVRVIGDIDQRAMQRDLFDTMKGNPTRLIGLPFRPDP